MAEPDYGIRIVHNIDVIREKHKQPSSFLPSIFKSIPTLFRQSPPQTEGLSDLLGVNHEHDSSGIREPLLSSYASSTSSKQKLSLPKEDEDTYSKVLSLPVAPQKELQKDRTGLKKIKNYSLFDRKLYI